MLLHFCCIGFDYKKGKVKNKLEENLIQNFYQWYETTSTYNCKSTFSWGAIF